MNEGALLMVDGCVSVEGSITLNIDNPIEGEFIPLFVSVFS